MKMLNLRYLVGLILIAGLTFIISCNDDDDMNSGEVELLSFGPAGVNHGDEIVFIGNNLNKVTSIMMQPNLEIASGSFTSQSASRITVVVPNEAEAGKVMLVHPTGQIESKTMLNFLVEDIEVASITAASRPGDNITITGTHVNYIGEVRFSDGLSVTKDEYISSSVSEIVVPVPMAAQTGNLIFVTDDTDPKTFASEDPLEVTLPAITDLSPDGVRHTENLTITGTDLDLVTEVVLPGGDLSVLAVDFVDHTATSIVVTIPSPIETGTITLKQVAPVDVVSTEEVNILLPTATSIDPTPTVPGVDDLTITGTELDQIAQLNIPGVGVVNSSEFISHSATEIVVDIPEGAEQGGIGYVTIHGYENTIGALILPSDGPPALLSTFIDEGINSALFDQGGGWSSTQDWASTEQAREGDVSVKVEYTGNWGGAAQAGQWNGQSPASTAGTEVFVFSVFGGSGTSGQNIQIAIKDQDGAQTDLQFPIEQGIWSDIEIPLEDLGNPTGITEFFFQNTDQWTGVVYIDRVGLSIASGPPELLTIVYDDALNSALFDQGGGWSSTQDWASTDQVRQGDTSIKVEYTGNWGGGAQCGQWNGQAPMSTAGSGVFAFSIYGGAGTDGGQNIQIAIKDQDGTQYDLQYAIEFGAWTDIEVPLADIGNATGITEFFFQNTDQWTGVVYFDYIGLR